MAPWQTGVCGAEREGTYLPVLAQCRPAAAQGSGARPGAGELRVQAVWKPPLCPSSSSSQSAGIVPWVPWVGNAPQPPTGLSWSRSPASNQRPGKGEREEALIGHVWRGVKEASPAQRVPVWCELCFVCKGRECVWARTEKCYSCAVREVSIPRVGGQGREAGLRNVGVPGRQSLGCAPS